VTQFGPTIEVYRTPDDLTTAKTFADPPLNTIDVVKTGGRFQRQWRRCCSRAGASLGMADGPL
jgi:glycerol transport system ATP-binding protein